MAQQVMVQQIRSVLENAFTGIGIEELIELPTGRIAGSVSWAGFAGMDDVERQERIRTVLKDEMGPDAQLVGVLLAYTPEELTSMRAA